MDRERLIKILNLTTSENDAEALSAIRAANSLLKKANCLWDTILKDQVAVTVTKTKVRRPESLREILDACLEVASGKPLEFLEGLSEAFDHYGRLTVRQRDALFRTYDNLFGEEVT